MQSIISEKMQNILPQLYIELSDFIKKCILNVDYSFKIVKQSFYTEKQDEVFN